MASVLALAALTVVACGSGSSNNGGGGTGGSYGFNQAANANTGGTPQYGGTLKIIGNADVDHLDTASAYYTTTGSLMRLFTRQLFTYPATTDTNAATTPAADLATEIPTKANGGISADGKTYTIHIRQGADWSTTPARQVSADDVILGFKRLCNPTQNSVGAPQYYNGVIQGMKQYCDGFTNVAQTIPAFKQYMTTNDISGIKAVDPTTVQFTLVQPASDFLNILAMNFSSPAPVEYLNYLPDDSNFRQNTISDGPYKITKYVPSQSYVLDKNPAWKQSTDPIRHQYVNEVQVTMGPDETGVQQQIQAGTQDLEWDTTVPTADVPQLKGSKDARLGIYPGFDNNPFLVFNEQSPNANGALKNPKVRQALEYAINNIQLGKIYGGPTLNTPLHQVLAPGNVGYQQFNLYPTPGNNGDPAKCKQLLAQAGYPNGFSLTDVYRTSGKHPDVFQAVQTDFAACGVTVNGKPAAASDFYGKYIQDPTAAKAGSWDIAEPGWVPDWFGNNARANIEPLFDGRGYGPGSTDWGDYMNQNVNNDIDNALKASTPADAAKYMHDADVQIMKDAAIIPFQTQSNPIYRSTRVHNALYIPTTAQYDYANVWLSQ
ncbi:MAG TPA: ABC transporter substrate-binding protein [Pseudonocardiaceae bacterium]|nr:ABC transporter substrate-binding protein [Pseudonocardiaceae bacterium]